MTYKEIEQATGIKRNSSAPLVTNHKFFVKRQNVGKEAAYYLSDKGSVAVTSVGPKG
jgi:hypothetical protein